MKKVITFICLFTAIQIGFSQNQLNLKSREERLAYVRTELELTRDSLKTILEKFDKLQAQKNSALDKLGEKEAKFFDNNPKPVKGEFETTSQFADRTQNWNDRLAGMRSAHKIYVKSIDKKLQLQSSANNNPQYNKNLKAKIDEYDNKLASLEHEFESKGGMSFDVFKYDADNQVFNVTLDGKAYSINFHKHPISEAKRLKENLADVKIAYVFDRPYAVEFQNKQYFLENYSSNFVDKIAKYVTQNKEYYLGNLEDVEDKNHLVLYKQINTKALASWRDTKHLKGIALETMDANNKIKLDYSFSIDHNGKIKFIDFTSNDKDIMDIKNHPNSGKKFDKKNVHYLEELLEREIKPIFRKGCKSTINEKTFKCRYPASFRINMRYQE